MSFVLERKIITIKCFQVRKNYYIIVDDIINAISSSIVKKLGQNNYFDIYLFSEKMTILQSQSRFPE